MPLKNYPFNPFTKGIFSKVPIQSVPEGAAYDSLNWLTEEGAITLRRGYAILGPEILTTGRVSGLGVGIRNDGYQVPFRTRDSKIEEYDAPTNTWIEIGTNALGTAALGEDVSIEPFQSIAGGQVFLNSPNSGLKKIIVANPGNYIDLFNPTVNYKSLIRIKQNRMFAFNITNNPATSRDINNIRLSQLETRGLKNFTLVTSEAVASTDGVLKTFTHTLANQSSLALFVAALTQVTAEVEYTGDGHTLSFVGTLGFKSGNPNGNCVNVSFSNGNGETLIDNGDGTLNSGAGGTGTINYVTGVYSITFFAAPPMSDNITSTYQWWDTVLTESFADNGIGGLTGTLGGTGTINYTTGALSITFNAVPTTGQTIKVNYRYDNTSAYLGNFVQPSPASSYVSGNPNFFQQSDGGAFQNIFTLSNVEYCIHTKKMYALTLTNDETNATNYLYRDHIGIPYFRAGVATQDGIYCIDVSDLNDPKIVLIKVAKGSVEIIPTWISQALDLTNFIFDKCASFLFNDYIVFSCRTPDSPVNNRAWIYNWRFKTFDLVDYYISCMENYNGSLVAGDSLSPNVQTLFSGFDDDGNTINNYWKSGVHKLGFLNSRGKKWPIRAMKRNKGIILEGLVSPEQVLRMYVSLDRGPFVEVQDTSDKMGNPNTTVANLGAFIKGSGAYVDKTNGIAIGSTLIGQKSIGDGQPIVTPEGSEFVTVYHFNRQLNFNKDKFVDVQVMFEAIDIGYVSITGFTFQDIRVKQDKVARKYRTTV